MSTQTTASPRHLHPTSRASNRPPPTPAPLNTNSLLPPTHRTHTPSQINGPRSPSPNYFGRHITDPSVSIDFAHRSRSNWSPPSSSVRSAAILSPTVIPADQNPDFAAFRRQSEGSSKAFTLGSLNFGSSPSPQNLDNEISDGWVSPRSVSNPLGFKTTQPPTLRSVPRNLDPDSASLTRSPKRHLSSDSSTFPAPPRKASPANNLSPTQSAQALVRHSAEPATSNGAPDRDPRMSLPSKSTGSVALPKQRAETVPASTSGDNATLVTPQHVINLFEAAAEEILILDIRVSTQYAKSRIAGALNLCIPTTLLKRPSFNVQKLAESFKNADQKRKFEKWRNSKYIIVYDASASQVKDATIPFTTIRKFESEGYQGTPYIIKGGFDEFAKAFPSYVDKDMESSGPNGASPKLSFKPQDPNLPPVIGGCPMPATKSAANPFFGNIRQNMDLIGGVGQMPIKLPDSMTRDIAEQMPQWLRAISSDKDKGAKASERFLHIEKREQKRMQDALSGAVSYGSPTPGTARGVEIAGIEKGAKNRYNNIWPFEHTRVRLQGVPDNGCDYFNANFVKSSLSNKRYIATQGPIPATFNDFWNVVWQQDVRVVVMLTAEKEGGQIKAHNYWSEGTYGHFSLQELSERRASLEPEKINRHRHRSSVGSRRAPTEPSPALTRQEIKETSSEQPYVIVRKLAISNEQYPFERVREITQLQYTSWPDFGAPAHPAHLLGLVEQCNGVVSATNGTNLTEPEPPNSRPVLVHCSAGCGRTGTFCTVDSVIDMMKRQRASSFIRRQYSPMDIDCRTKPRESPFFASPPGSAATNNTEDPNTDTAWLRTDDKDLVEKTVEDFRLQRLSMVQSLRQFVLCYESILEWIVEQDRLDNESYAAFRE